MYGVSLGQSAYYVWSFPKDPIFIKLLVLLVFIADFAHMVGITEFYWNMLVLCHRRRDGTMCVTNLPWGSFVAVPMNYVIIFAVQSLYCHRIWIITRSKRSITAAIFVLAVSQADSNCSVTRIRNGTLEFLYTTPLVPLAAGVSTVCDITITTTIFTHLWKSELRGRTNVIRDLVVVFINMGALTWQVSQPVLGSAADVLVSWLAWYLLSLFLAQGDRYWIGAPAVVLSRCYANSLLAVLNARRTIRERELRQYRYTIEIPTLSTII
ncbi:hypothetical protein JVU11DRAFT_10750 [Chiua virens]|nr:hypothetical protein JVU11DRAFT_10750 [Chiua virens]